jgi:hypothetical protein
MSELPEDDGRLGTFMSAMVIIAMLVLMGVVFYMGAVMVF